MSPHFARATCVGDLAKMELSMRGHSTLATLEPVARMGRGYAGGEGAGNMIEVVDMKSRRADFANQTDPAFLILISLADGPKHGYGIMKEVAARASVRMRTGTVYETLARLQEEGLIEALPLEGRRQPYQLTPTGVATLRDQLLRLDELARTALRQLPAE